METSNSSKDTSNAIVVLITNGLGGLLFGKRKEDNKWSLVAGHIRKGESPEQAAYREIFEESGLKATFLTPVGVQDLTEGTSLTPFKVYFFSTQIQGTPTNENDPDHEFSKVVWVDVRQGIPKNIYNHLSGPKGDANIVRQIYDLKKSEQIWLDAGFMDLSFSILKKSVDKPEHNEILTLLKHPNPVERQIALKLSSVTPEHIALGILDPNAKVFETAFNHPDSSYALHVLASNTRDAAGNPIFDRHDLLLKDKRLHPEHLELMAGAIKNDTSLPIQEQTKRLLSLSSFDLMKHESLWAHTLLYSGSSQENTGKVADASHEETHEHLKPLKQAYESGINGSPAIEPHNAGLHDVGQTSPKAVYNINNNKYMVKPYEEEEHPLSGWAESTSQKLYHAAGLGHLHQQSFASNHGGGKYNIPATVIKLEPDAIPVHKAALHEYRSKNPGLEDEARKIAVMDYITGNNDRHSNNLMIRPNGHLLAIDHSMGFNTVKVPFKQWLRFGTSHGTHLVAGAGLGSIEHEKHYDNLIRNWWPQVSSKIKEAFHQKLEGIKHLEHKRRLKEGFDARVFWLDDEASKQDLNKTLEGSDFIHKQHDTHNLAITPDLTDVHNKLKMATPDAIKPLREHFELNLNQPKQSHKPVLSYDPVANHRSMGEEPKSIYQHGDKKFLIKPQVGPSTSMSGWNELTSQSMYHAGGIGHLHQKVHATTLANHPKAEYGKDPHAVVIHMEPGVKQANEAEHDEDPRLQKMRLTPEHVQSLKKIGLMDWLTGNQDRHSGNIMIREDGSPICIDNGRGFSFDREHALGDENPSLHRSSTAKRYFGDYVKKHKQNPKEQLSYFDDFGGTYSDADVYSGGGPDKETWDWWDKNKENMRNAFIKHVNMLPNQEMRDKMLRSFDVRFNHLEDFKDTKLNPQDYGLSKPSLANRGFNTTSS